VLKDLRVIQVLKDHKVLLETKVPLVLKDLKVIKVQLVLKDLRVLQEPLVLLDHKDQQVRKDRKGK
jgi:hypothetical protein